MIELKTLLMAYSAVMGPIIVLFGGFIILLFKMLSEIGRELRDIKGEFGNELAVIKERLKHTATKEELKSELATIKEKLEHTATKEEMLSIKEELKNDSQEQTKEMLSTKEELKGGLQKQSERLMRVEHALTHPPSRAPENLPENPPENPPEKKSLKVGEKKPQKYKGENGK